VVEYYEKNFELQDGMDNYSGENWTVCVQTAESYVVPPNVVDKVIEIGKLKNGKAKGQGIIKWRPNLFKSVDKSSSKSFQ
jgi:hypothetical protein